MSEKPQNIPSNLDATPLFSSAYITSTTTAAGIGGAIAGSIVANYRYPTEIEYADGIHANASITLNPNVVVDTPISQIVSPNVPVDTPLIGFDGIHTTFDQVQLNLSDKRAQGEYIGLLTNFNDAVIKPTAENIVNHLAMGAGIGAATAAGLTYAAIRYARRTKKDELDISDDIASLKDEGTEASIRSADRQEKRLKRNVRDRKIGALVLSAVALIGASVTVRDIVEVESASSDQGTPLVSILTDQVPELKNTRITGGADQINTVIYAINNQKVKADKAWKLGYKNLQPALKTYNDTFGSKFENDPDIIKIAHISDLHCNLANYSNYFGKALPKLAPDVIAITGDTQTNSGTTFYEKSCMPGLIDILNNTRKVTNSTIPVVNIAGNHDDKKPYNGGKYFYNLTTKKPAAKIQVGKIPETPQSITFVGQQDPRQTIWYPTLPAGKTEENIALVNQSKEISEEACKQKLTESTVVVLGHSEQSGYSTLIYGCADLVLNGHTHKEKPIKTFSSTIGRNVLQHTSGSTSGAGERFSIYEAPQQDASMTIIYWSLSKQRFVGYYTTTLHKDGKINISFNDLPANPEPDSVIAKMESYEANYARLPNNPTPKDKVAVIKNG